MARSPRVQVQAPNRGLRSIFVKGITREPIEFDRRGRARMSLSTVEKWNAHQRKLGGESAPQLRIITGQRPKE